MLLEVDSYNNPTPKPQYIIRPNSRAHGERLRRIIGWAFVSDEGPASPQLGSFSNAGVRRMCRAEAGSGRVTILAGFSGAWL